MHNGKKTVRDMLDALPVVDSGIINHILAEELGRFGKKVIVLDDDPAGVQTVHGVSVYTDWSLESIEQGFREKELMFFLLTNSRGMIASETEAAHQEIAANIAAIAEKLNQPFIIISRGDSTLRGHYPLETETLKDTVEARSDRVFDGEVIIPFFREGGRFTIDNVHYVQYGDELVPAGETEFALDRTFGYTKSDLGEWVEEKTGGRYRKADTTCISLESLRKPDIDGITQQLLRVEGFNKIVVNAVNYTDVKVFTIALIRAMRQGKNFMFRSAASFTKVIGGVSDKAMLTRDELLDEDTTGRGGLIIVGSHVQKTTEQLEQLKTCASLEFIELDCHLVTRPEAFRAEIDRVVSRTESLLASGRTVTVYTRRERLDLGEDRKEEELQLSVQISEAVTDIVRRLQTRPAYMVAKGGITSSDIGTKGLKVRRATVAGQIKPGIPVWITGDESKFPGIPYIIFPGNVGTSTTLKETVQMLESPDRGGQAGC